MYTIIWKSDDGVLGKTVIGMALEKHFPTLTMNTEYAQAIRDEMHYVTLKEIVAEGLEYKHIPCVICVRGSRKFEIPIDAAVPFFVVYRENVQSLGMHEFVIPWIDDPQEDEIGKQHAVANVLDVTALAAAIAPFLSSK